jgi:hypothetical protein
MALGIVVTYFVLAPPDASSPGFGLGSGGLAGKMVIMQLLAVNVIAIYLARSLQVEFDWVYQPVSLLICLGMGWLAYVIPQWSFGIGAQGWVGMLVSAMFYLMMIIGTVWLTPSLAGLSRNEILALTRRLASTDFRS